MIEGVTLGKYQLHTSIFILNIGKGMAIGYSRGHVHTSYPSY